MSTPRGSGGRNTTNRGRGGGVNTTGGHGGGANTHGGRGVGVQSGGQQRKSPVDVRVKPAESTDKKKSEGLNLTNLYTFLKGRLEHYKLSSKAQCTSIMNVIEIMAEQKTERSAEESQQLYQRKCKDLCQTLEGILNSNKDPVKANGDQPKDPPQNVGPKGTERRGTTGKGNAPTDIAKPIEKPTETMEDVEKLQLYQRKCNDMCLTLEGILNSNKDPVKANGYQPKEPPQNVGPKGTEGRGTKHTTGKGNAPTDIAKPTEKPKETIEDVEKLIKNVQQQMEERERELKGIPALVKNLKLECVRMCDDLKEPLPENIDIRPNEEEPVMFLEIKNKIDRARQAVAEILNGRAETELAISQLKEKNGQLDGDVKELTLRQETFRFCNESSDKQLASLQSLLLKPATFATKDSCKEAYIEQHSEPEEEQTPGKTPNPKRKTEDIAGHGDSMSCVDKYTHKCLQLSWLASVQTPPIYALSIG
ncbi:hypothetical protein MAR_022325 [Mya arenaria]|uniref:Uncharacterized protein n=1 Tax=Mya arenaria TaxID=6604 RepID=A0ABY7DMK9_MYAAR|nr:hypothetical protein MAR_022325 [Mya arenaria]